MLLIVQLDHQAVTNNEQQSMERTQDTGHRTQDTGLRNQDTGGDFFHSPSAVSACLLLALNICQLSSGTRTRYINMIRFPNRRAGFQMDPSSANPFGLSGAKKSSRLYL